MIGPVPSPKRVRTTRYVSHTFLQKNASSYLRIRVPNSHKLNRRCNRAQEPQTYFRRKEKKRKDFVSFYVDDRSLGTFGNITPPHICKDPFDISELLEERETRERDMQGTNHFDARPIDTSCPFRNLGSDPDQKTRHSSGMPVFRTLATV